VKLSAERFLKLTLSFIAPQEKSRKFIGEKQNPVPFWNVGFHFGINDQTIKLYYQQFSVSDWFRIDTVVFMGMAIIHRKQRKNINA